MMMMSVAIGPIGTSASCSALSSRIRLCSDGARRQLLAERRRGLTSAISSCHQLESVARSSSGLALAKVGSIPCH